MVHGKIGSLKLDVPYMALRAKPVHAELNDLYLVVRPITDSSEWDFSVLLKDQES